MKIIDCIGLVCPMPVIKTKKALAEDGAQKLEIRVDNGISLENVQKYLFSLGYDSVCITRSGHFAIIVNADGDFALKADADKSGGIAVISGDVMGSGDDDLGRLLMKNFIFALTQLDVLPQTVVLYNRGVLLAVENSPALEDLQVLEAAGAQILSCGLCLSHFGREDGLKVGETTNMYAIAEMLQSGATVIRP